MLHGIIDRGSEGHVALCNAHFPCIEHLHLSSKESLPATRRMGSGTFGDVRGGSFDASARLREGSDPG